MAIPSQDLTSILQSLQAYAPQPLQAAPAPQDLDLEYDPTQFDPSLSLALQSHKQRQQPQSLPEYHSHESTTPPSMEATLPQQSNPPPAPSSQPQQSKAPPSTRNITTYPTALRHITTHLLSLPHFTPRVCHLITTQHKHEREWHAGRQTLLKQLQNRDSSRKKLDEVLASVGGKIATSSTEEGEGDGGKGELSKEDELKAYDRKVWRAQKEMVVAAERELGRLGVPFFEEERRERWEGREDELRELRGRVVGLLEDLSGANEEERGKGFEV